MKKITESDIEEFTIELLKRLGYQYIYGPNMAPDLSASTGQAGGIKPERTNYETVLLEDRLKNAIRSINPRVSAEAQQEAIKEIRRLHSPGTVDQQRNFPNLSI